MRNSLFYQLLISALLANIYVGPILADEPSRYRNVAALGTPVGREQDTSLLLDQQNRAAQAGANSLDRQGSIQSGQERANEMVEMLKTEEMQKALQKVTKKGKQVLQEDPSLRTPIGMIAGAVSLWVGNTVKLFKGESVVLSTRIEGRNRASEFSMESPLMNGKFRFSANDGIDIYMNRKISSIGSQAEFNYNLRNQIFTTTIRQRIAPNLDFSFGASQIPQSTTTDGNARIEYRFNF